MARGKRRERRRRTESSNRRLPTFTPTRAQEYFSDPTIPEVYEVFPTARFQFNAPIPIAVPQPTAKVPLSKAAFQPTGVLEGGRAARGAAKRRALASPIETLPEASGRERARPPADECVRRRTRTEVIHALGHAGRGGQKSPRWTERSKIKC